jgi:hypothetical protein
MATKKTKTQEQADFQLFNRFVHMGKRGVVLAAPKLQLDTFAFPDIYRKFYDMREDLGTDTFRSFCVEYFKVEILRPHTEQDPNPNYLRIMAFAKDCVLINLSDPDATPSPVYNLIKGKDRNGPFEDCFEVCTTGFDPAHLSDDAIFEFMGRRVKTLVANARKKATEHNKDIDDPAERVALLPELPGHRQRAERGSSKPKSNRTTLGLLNLGRAFNNEPLVND